MCCWLGYLIPGFTATFFVTGQVRLRAHLRSHPQVLCTSPCSSRGSLRSHLRLSRGGQKPSFQKRFMPYRRFESNPFSQYEYDPHPWQLLMHQSPAKMKWVQAGRRAGKTRASLQEDLDQIDLISRKFVHNQRTDKYLTAEKAGLIPSIHCWSSG